MYNKIPLTSIFVVHKPETKSLVISEPVFITFCNWYNGWTENKCQYGKNIFVDKQ